MKKIKEILKDALYGMVRSYEGKGFVPSLVIKLVMSLAASVITAFFADTLFSLNNTANQIFAALFFWFLITAVSGIILEIRRGGFGGRLIKVLGDMVRLKRPALWFFIAAVVISLFLPYAFVLALAALLFSSAVSGENSTLLSVKNAVTNGKNPERNGKGLAAFTSGLIACGLLICLLSNLGVPTLYGLIDGRGGKNVSWSDSGGGDEVSGNKTTNPDSGDTDITEAAQSLTDKLIDYAGKDRKSFEKLFRDTESSVIDKYYNTSYDTFREYSKNLIAIAARNDDSVWFTALYYQIPADYPAEKEKSVYLSTIMTYGDDGWKIEWNDEVRSALQSAYYDAGSSSYGREARDEGYAWAKFFIPFDIEGTKIFYEDAVMCKVVEMYTDINNNLQITLYLSNDTDADVELTNVYLTVSDGDVPLFGRSFDTDRIIRNGDGYTCTLTIPSEELDFISWSEPRISDFRFSYEVK